MGVDLLNMVKNEPHTWALKPIEAIILGINYSWIKAEKRLKLLAISRRVVGLNSFNT